MSQKEKLIKRILKKPKDFTIAELDSLMSSCGCERLEGGRGSGVKYVHKATKRCLTFDLPHPIKELRGRHIKMVLEFLSDVGEINLQ